MKKPPSGPEIRIVATAQELGLAAALQLVYRGKKAILEKNLFTVVLGGGSTFQGAYSRLADDPTLNRQLSWGSVHFFWSHEHLVPPDHEESLYRAAYETLLKKLPLPKENVHRIKGEYRSAGRAAHEYEGQLRRFFALKPRQRPRFDLVLLGMGTDGRTASLFPGSEVLREQKRWVVGHWIEQLKAHRITLTAPVLNNAARVIFLVSGEEKAETLNQILFGEYQPERYPAQVIRPVSGKLLWLVDKAAARLLSNYRDE